MGLLAFGRDCRVRKTSEYRDMQREGRKDENSSCARCDIYLNDHYTRDNIDGFPVEKLR